MTNIDNWIPAIGICTIIFAIASLMAATVLGEIKNVLLRIYEQDQEVTEQLMERRK